MTAKEWLTFQQTRVAMAAGAKVTPPPEVIRAGAWGPFSLLFALSGGCLGRMLGATLIVGLALSFFFFGGALFGRAPVTQLAGAGDGVDVVAWSPDGTRIAAGSEDQTVRIWDVQNGRQLLVRQGYDAGFKALAWSPDGTSLAVDGPSIGMVQILEVQSGKTLALGTSASTVLLWRADGASTPRVYSGHRFAVNSLAWSADGTRIVSVGSDTRGVSNGSAGIDEIQIWDVATLHLVYAYSTTLISELTVRTVNWSPDGKRIAIGTGSYDFQVWDAETGHHLQTYGTPDEEVYTLTWSPDGTRLVEAGQSHTISIYAPRATFIGQTSLYDLTLVGVFAAAFMLLILLLGLTGRRPPGRTWSMLLWILLVCALTALLMALMITIGLNPLFWDSNA